jgi:hypothetical protein
MANSDIKETITHKIELTTEQLKGIIKQYAMDTFGYTAGTEIGFTIADTNTCDDRFGGCPSYGLTKCTITCKK